MLPLQGAWVQSLVKELRSQMLCSMAKKKKKKRFKKCESCLCRLNPDCLHGRTPVVQSLPPLLSAPTRAPGSSASGPLHQLFSVLLLDWLLLSFKSPFRCNPFLHSPLWPSLSYHPSPHHRNYSALLRWHSGKASTCHFRRQGFDPFIRKIPWRGKWQPAPVFLP